MFRDLEDDFAEFIRHTVCEVDVRWSISQVTASAFEGLRTLQRHRMVLSAIKHLMSGDDAPVHAVDSLATNTP